VFKIERGQAGEKIAYVRMFSGAIHTRDQLYFGRGAADKVTAIRVFDRGADAECASIVAGEIGKLKGLSEVRVGDAIGTSNAVPEQHYFAPPTLETVVTPRHPSDKIALCTGLDQLAEQDPLINLRQDDTRQELYVSLYGEVQKEVIQATLANDFGIEAEFRTSTTIYVERPIGAGEAVEVKREAPNPFLATIGLRVEPAALNSGVEFQLAGAVVGKMPLAFFKAVEDTVYKTLSQGLHGWQVIDCIITMTHAGYMPRQSHAHQRFSKSMSSTGEDFRGLTPLVLLESLRRAGTRVCEPIHHFELEIPAGTLSVILPLLTRLGTFPHETEARGSLYVLKGDIPAGRVYDLQQQVPALTSGEGVLECVFDRYAVVPGEIPTRPRTDNNPLDRKAYLLRLGRRT
jgi:ribosomal protection tetracycline resistance protein